MIGPTLFDIRIQRHLGKIQVWTAPLNALMDMAISGAPRSIMAGPADVHHIFLLQQSGPVDQPPVRDFYMKSQVAFVAEVGHIMTVPTGRIALAFEPLRIRRPEIMRHQRLSRDLAAVQKFIGLRLRNDPGAQNRAR